MAMAMSIYRTLRVLVYVLVFAFTTIVFAFTTIVFARLTGPDISLSPEILSALKVNISGVC